jgi:hypothetical protein
MNYILSLFIFLNFFTSPLFGHDTIIDPATNVNFPAKITISHDGKTYNLNATGVATRKKFFVKVYSIASYLQDGATIDNNDKFQSFFNDKFAKQLSLKFVHEASVDQIRDAFRESFNNSAFNTPQIQDDIHKFIGFFTQPVKVGDEQTLTWFPGGYLEVKINGQVVGNITDKDFVAGLWSIWLGENGPVNRNELVSQLK